LRATAEVRLIAVRELHRSVHSAKGIVLGVLTLLGTFAASAACAWLEEPNAESRSAQSAQAHMDLKRAVIAWTTGDSSLATSLAATPTCLLLCFEITVWLLPLLVALLGFDAVSGEVQHGTIRFWAVRARRPSYIMGKFVALWALVGIVTLSVNLLGGAVAVARGYVSVGETFSWGVRLWLATLAIASAWAAAATFIGSCFRTPILALLTTLATFFFSWIVSVVGGFVVASGRGVESDAVMPMPWYRFFYPNAYDALLLSPNAMRALGALCILVTATGLITAVAATLFARRDI
jgi:ABC-type transport system involved in multi-copper enzyme maturation permease subunit